MAEKDVVLFLSFHFLSQYFSSTVKILHCTFLFKGVRRIIFRGEGQGKTQDRKITPLSLPQLYQYYA